MNVNIAIGLFLLVGFIYVMLISIFTVLFRLTGVTQEKARFQVVSLFTTSGFTTRESEIMLASLERRRLSRGIMLTGYVFSVLIVSLIINLALSIPQSKSSDFGLITILITVAFVLMFILTRIKPLQTRFTHFIENLARRALYSEQNKIVILDFYHDKIIAQVFIKKLPDELRGKTLAESDIKNRYEVQIMLINRQGEALLGVSGDAVLQDGDAITVYADSKKLEELFVLSPAVPDSAGKKQNHSKTALH